MKLSQNSVLLIQENPADMVRSIKPAEREEGIIFPEEQEGLFFLTQLKANS